MKTMRRSSRATSPDPRLRRVAVGLCALTGYATVALALCAGLLNGFAQSPPAQSASAPNQTTASSPNAKPGTASAAAPSQNGAQASGTATDPQKQELASECAQLLKMASALKSEVDKTNKDTLSVTVVRKAGEIEQLAHKARSGTGKS